MKDLLLIAVILLAWIALNRWILPALGIPTCMSGACSTAACQSTAPADQDPTPEPLNPDR